MKTFVKLCGLREEAAIQRVPEGGAAGFVVGVPASPRNLTVEEIAERVPLVPSNAEAWAVTVAPTAELVRRLFDEAGVDRIQVYGAIPDGLDFLERHHLVPSLPLGRAGEPGSAPAVPPAEEFPRLHLDTGRGALPGGSGETGNWAVAAQLVNDHPGRKFVLAGGLTPENVTAALDEVHPWGVDVSSGIERAPGVKDLARIDQFLAAVAEYERRHA